MAKVGLAEVGFDRSRWTVRDDECPLRPLLFDLRGMKLLFELGKNLSRRHIPSMVVDMVRTGRITALHKPDGGVRGIMAGDVVRRLVARTMSY